nr:hypothetical protein [Streptomyces fimicarius]
MNLRMIGLTAAVVFGCLVPLVASADPAVDPTPAPAFDSIFDAASDPSGEPADAKSSGGSPEMLRPKVSDELSGEGAADAHSSSLLKSPSRMSTEAGSLPEFDRTGAVARCGPELVAPEGVEAQTCVMTQDGETWARTYYRNATGEELRSVLTLMGPAGRAVELHCAPAAHDEPGLCETPRIPSPGASRSTTAVAEFLGAGPVGEAPLLLRAGSERAPGAED